MHVPNSAFGKKVLRVTGLLTPRRPLGFLSILTHFFPTVSFTHQEVRQLLLHHSKKKFSRSCYTSMTLNVYLPYNSIITKVTHFTLLDKD